MTTPRSRACCRQRFTRLFSELYCRGVNRPGNCTHSSSNSWAELMLGNSSRRRHTRGQTLRKARLLAVPVGA
jgi:hypothetical protein